MEPKVTRFSQVYNGLKRRILTGQLPPGGRLPSCNMLCEEYHTGVYTVRQVLAALRDEGLIETAPRRAAVVCRTLPQAGAEAGAVLQQRGRIADVYQTYALVMPVLLTFACRTCRLELTAHYKQAQRMARSAPDPADWRTVTLLAKDVLHSTDNPLPGEIYALFEREVNLAFFAGQPGFQARFLMAEPNPLKTFPTMLAEQDAMRQYYDLSVMYGDLCHAACDVLVLLAEDPGGAPAEESSPEAGSPEDAPERDEPPADIPPENAPEPDEPFPWAPVSEKRPRYARIARELSIQIGAGQYPPGTFLPSEGRLAARYGVAAATMRQALDILARRGFTRTVNGKGTTVLSPESGAPFFADPAARQEALNGLYALQVLVLLAYPLAQISAHALPLEALPPEEQEDGAFEAMFRMLLGHLRLEPFRAIVRETADVAQGAFLFSWRLPAPRAARRLDRLAGRAMRYLRRGEQAYFGRALSDCFRGALELARDTLPARGEFAAARALRTPGGPLQPEAYA